MARPPHAATARARSARGSHGRRTIRHRDDATVGAAAHGIRGRGDRAGGSASARTIPDVPLCRSRLAERSPARSGVRRCSSDLDPARQDTGAGAARHPARRSSPHLGARSSAEYRHVEQQFAHRVGAPSRRGRRGYARSARRLQGTRVGSGPRGRDASASWVSRGSDAQPAAHSSRDRFSRAPMTSETFGRGIPGTSRSAGACR